MSKKRGLGIGLSELLGDVKPSAPAAPVVTPLEKSPPAASTTTHPDGQLTYLAVEKLMPGRYQPRKTMAEEPLTELANSIRAQGIIQPIVVRKTIGNQYEIIAGERRWRAAQLAGLTEVPVIARDIADEAAIAMSLIENIQREELNPIEESQALQRLLTEFELTHQEVADAVGRSRTSVTNLLRLQKLNPSVRALVEQGKLEMGHARALLALEGVQQSEAAESVVKRQLSVRETENLVRHLLAGLTNKKPTPKLDPDVARLQSNISEKLGAAVAIQHSTNGKGKVVIRYNSLDELEGILDHIE